MDEMVMGKFSFQAFFRLPELSALKKVTGGLSAPAALSRRCAAP